MTIEYNSRWEPLAILHANQNGIVQIQTFVDDYLTYEHTLRVEKTRYPVEGGASYTDHAVKQPNRLRVQGWVSDVFPVLGMGARPGLVVQTTTEEGGAVYDPRGLANRAQLAWQEINRLMTAREIVTVITTLGVYRNMLVTEAVAPQSRRTGQGLRFTMTLEEVLYGELIQVRQPPEDTVTRRRFSTMDYGPITRGQMEDFTNPYFETLFSSSQPLAGEITEYFYPFHAYSDQAPPTFIPGIIAPGRRLNVTPFLITFKRIPLTMAGSDSVGRHRMSVPIERFTRARRFVANLGSDSAVPTVQPTLVFTNDIQESREAGADVVIESVRLTIFWHSLQQQWLCTGLASIDRRTTGAFITDESGQIGRTTFFNRSTVVFPNNRNEILQQQEVGPESEKIIFSGPLIVGSKMINSPLIDADIVLVPVFSSPEDATGYFGPQSDDQELTPESLTDGSHAVLVLNPQQGRFWQWPPVPETVEYWNDRVEQRASIPLR